MTPKYNKITLASIAVCVVTLITAVTGFFTLPQKIFVQVMANSSTPETSTTLFLIASVLIVVLASMMCIFSENTKKWLAIEVVLAIAFLGCLVYNFMVM